MFKKTGALALFIVVAFSLVACGAAGTGQAAEPVKETQPEEPVAVVEEVEAEEQPAINPSDEAVVEPEEPEESEEASEPEEVVKEGDEQVSIIDSAGKEVMVPADIERVAITCYGGASHELIVLNGKDKIVAQPDMKRFKQIVRMMPEFAESPEVGKFDDVRIEDILLLEPDVVIASVSAQKGNALIEEADIPVVTVLTGNANIEELENEFMMIGQLLHEEEQASLLVDYWEGQLGMIEERLSDIPAEERKTVYYMLGSTLHTNGQQHWGQYFISRAGGINVAEEITNSKDISLEELIQWNPQVMVLSGNEGTFIPVEDVQNDVQLANIQAVQNGELYLAPVGSFWWDRPSPEAILGITWLAKNLYPETFEDVDIYEETRYFYETFYGYDLSDEEIDGFLNPTSS